jgi:IclR family transcriptional regulator, KDG regulon repressor
MGRLVPAVVRALDILELFLDGDGTLSTPEITRQLGLPRTTVHELVSTLAARSYLVPVPEQPGKWQLGLRTYQLGSRYTDRLDLPIEARAVAREVAAKCRETVHVGVLDGTEVVYIAKVDSSHAVRMISAVGRRLPAHCTAVGKVMLSFLSDEELTDRYPADRKLPAMTRHTITSVDALRKDLRETRERGTSREFCESNPDVACVAAPVLDADGVAVAAMSVAVPTLRWTEERGEELSALVAEGARMLSERLGAH